MQLQLISQQLQESQLKTFKVIFIGDDGTGTTTLLFRLLTGEFKRILTATAGVDYKFKKVIHQGSPFILQLWDCAGHQRFWPIVSLYLKLSEAAVIVFCLKQDASLSTIQKRLQLLASRCGNEMPKILLGNKSDLFTPEGLQQKLQKLGPKIRALQQKYNCQYFTVSAKTGDGIKEAFDFLITKIYTLNHQAILQKPKKLGFKLKSSILENNKVAGKRKANCC